MNTIQNLLAAALCAIPAMAMAADPGLEIMHPGEAHTYVRVKDPQQYLLLPVEESVPDSRIEILVNGEKKQEIFVRLAANAIDYAVPLDLTPYTENGEVLLSINTPFDRGHSRQPRENVCWDKMKLASSFDTANTEKYRPAYHHTPLYGWMNDPNGMFYKDGTWHLYFQFNPYGSKWQNMTWGHSTSPDLVHWTQQPNAIEPDGIGTIFSGSCAIDHNNTAGFGENEVIAMYTAAGTSQVQSLGHSKDGQKFTKYPGNPVIVTPREARDPNMFWNAETGKWSLVLAGALDYVMHFYSSPDLKEWTYESSFGEGYGSHEGVWECPDLFPLDIDGKQKWVLLCNLNPGGKFGGSATQYFVGDFDGHKFTSDYAPTDTVWMDYGKDHYATVTFSDAPAGRRVALGWMSNWEYANEVPTKQFRSANTLPRDLSLFRAPDGKELLACKPSPEVDQLRGDKKNYGGFTAGKNVKNFALPADGLCEIVLDYNVATNAELMLTLTNDKGDKVDMEIDGKDLTFSMDRSQSGLTGFSHNFPAKTVAPLNAKFADGKIRLFIDRSSIEAFDAEGKFVMTNLVFPNAPYTTLQVSSRGGKAKVNNLTVYKINE